MSTSYSPNGTYPTFPLILPNNGEIVSFATLCVAILEPLIDAVGENCERTYTVVQNFDAGLSMGVAPILALDSTTDTATFTMDVSSAAWIGVPLSQQCAVTMRSSTAPIPAEGQVVHFNREPDGGGFSYVFKREGSGVAIVTVGASASDPRGASLIFRGGVWRLYDWTPGSTPGAEA